MGAAVAANSSCPVSLLQRLSIDAETRVRAAAVRNPNCPQALLRSFAADPDPVTRLNTATNTSCGADLLQQLSVDADLRVRVAAARNPNCPQALLRSFAADPDPVMRGNVASNPNCPPDDLLEQMSTDHHSGVVKDLARRVQCPESVLRILSSHKTIAVRRAVAAHPNCPLDLMAELAAADNNLAVVEDVARNPAGMRG